MTEVEPGIDLDTAERLRIPFQMTGTGGKGVRMATGIDQPGQPRYSTGCFDEGEFTQDVVLDKMRSYLDRRNIDQRDVSRR